MKLSMFNNIILLIIIGIIVTGCVNFSSTSQLKNIQNINTDISQNKNDNLNNNMQLTSPAFKQNEKIPAKYTCDGANINPPLLFNGVPAAAKSLVLIVDDPDAPGGTWLHWTLWDIRPDTKELAENSVPVGAVEGMTSFGAPGYGGPCPSNGTHHYRFKLYALDKMFDLVHGSTLSQLQSAMNGHILEQTELVGVYSRR